MSENILDIDVLSRLSNYFTEATGVSCGIFSFDAAKSFDCAYCKALSAHVELNCYELTSYACREAARFGGKYIYSCKSGLIHFIAAIEKDGIAVGALIAGPVLLMEKEEFLELEAKNRSEELYAELSHHLDSIPIVTPRRLSALSELLRCVSAGESSAFAKEKEMLAQQSVISNYIGELKLSPDCSYPVLKEKELLRAIEEGERTSAGKLLNEVLGYIYFSSGGDFSIIRAQVFELIVLLTRSAVWGGADSEKIFGLSYVYQSELHAFNNLDELTFWLSGIMLRFTEHVFRFNGVLHRDTMNKAVNYIEKNYMSRITLDNLAKEVCLSPTYFSRLFKKEMKSTFSEYLNRIRVWHAKNLLLNNNLSLADIAQMVGFEDQSYFSKVFKKETKITPLKFRETRGKIN